MSAGGKKTYKMDDVNRIPMRVWLIWLCGALFYAYQFILRVSSSVMTDHLMQAFSVQACTLGVLSAFYYNAYASMQIPVGMVIDRFGPRRLITIALFICVLGTGIFASATHVTGAAIGRFMMGIGSAFAYVGTLKIATLWFPRDYVGRVIGFTMVFGTLGGVVGGAPLGYLVEYLDWRQSMGILAVMGLGLALTSWILIRDRPTQLGYHEHVKGEYVTANLWEGVLKVMSSPQAWLVGVFAGLMYVPLAAFADLWGVPFIVEAYNVDRKIAASVTSMILVGAAIGSPITAYLSDRIRSRKLFMVVAAIGSTIMYTLVILVPNIPLPLMYIALFIAGVCFTGQVLGFTAVTEIMPISASGVAVGFTNMTVMLSGVIFEPLVGWLLDLHWKNNGAKLVNDIAVYSVDDFRFALLPIPISLFIALLLTKFIKETFPKT